jgi:hypothetical protein
MSHTNKKTLDQLLEEWKVYASLNSIMHNASRGHFKSLNYGLMIPSVVLSSLTGVGTIGIASKEESGSCGNALILLAFGAIGICSTCLLTVHRLMNVAELQKEHDLYSDMFESLANEIDMQLTLDESIGSKMFTNKQEFAKYCKSRMDILIDKAPPIPKGILKKYKPGQMTGMHACAPEVQKYPWQSNNSLYMANVKEPAAIQMQMQM